MKLITILPVLQVLHTAAPLGDVRPIVQFVHATAPEPDTFPLMHSIHTVLFVAPRTVLFDPGGQELQVEINEARVAVEYVPLPHFLQSNDDVLPTVLLHVPA